MRLGMVGLGKMGGNMVTRLLRGGHEVVVFDLDPELTKRAGSAQGAAAAGGPEEMAAALEPPRVVWVMVPAGAPTEETLRKLAGALQPGDVLVDGGNANFHDTK